MMAMATAMLLFEAVPWIKHAVLYPAHRLCLKMSSSLELMSRTDASHETICHCSTARIHLAIDVHCPMPVHFESSTSSGIDAEELVCATCGVVPADVVRRSSVLSCIAEAGADARLPDAVSEDSFSAWVKASKSDVSAADDMDYVTLCKVLKVWLPSITLPGPAAHAAALMPATDLV